MRHPSEGVLRRLLDEPAGVGEPDRNHVTGCTQCLGLLADIREDAALVGTALRATTTGPDLDLDSAWARLSAAADRGPSAPPAPVLRRSGGRLRAAVQRPAVAALGVALVLTGAGTAAANDWLPIFRTEQVQTVDITTADLVALPDLSAYGELVVTGDVEVREVAGASEAAEQTGLDLPQVAELPQGIDGEPAVQVGDKVSATFTFSPERAAAAAAAAGEPLPPMPPGLDGNSVRLDAGPGVAQVWTSAAGTPALVVGRAVAPTAFSSGVPFETVRDYLLSLPGLPDEVADQLRTFSADGSTLPLPVPSDRVVTSSADVNGVPATVLGTRDRALTAVVWVQDGMLTVVAGALDSDEVLEVARGLE